MIQKSKLPLGEFLDKLPKAMYVLAHILFLGVGLWLWARANDRGLPFAGALLLYALSQVIFFGYFAKWITLKMAVLAEQTLIFAMMILIVLRAT